MSSPQVEYIKARYAQLPVKALVQDYRNYDGPKVDYIVSVGMFEHVGATVEHVRAGREGRAKITSALCEIHADEARLRRC